ncbi:GPI transamidase component [Curvularia kusanoi]|uniref:GPI transamidase component n=1 Tax=Curvularia kusanoi TaxID=90978 RepID=A0A9P4TGP4_CURKU|nr:GPI transamidase component [Curvularia kusanoi]
MPLSAQGVQGVKSVLDKFTSEGPTGAPGLSFHAVDRSGKTLVEHQAGNLSVDSKQAVNEDTLFWIASCTKLVTAVALLQLVEQGKIALDDAEAIKKILPELSDKKVYADGVNGADQENAVTLRQLLSHTAGFGYAFFDARLTSAGEIEGQAGDVNDVLNARMVNQPGSMWEYGINLDWAGIVLERITGQRLGDYFREHIFTPLDIDTKGATMFPPTAAHSNLAEIHKRDPSSGELSVREHFYAHQLKQDTPDKQDAFFQSGGAGLFAKPKEYVKLLATILNEGTSPTTGKQILKPESVELFWENQIPNQPDFARGGPPPANPELVNASPEFYPQPGNPPQGWTYAGFLTIEAGPTGRGKNTIWWMGLANCFWWVDREKGVAGFLAGQVLPNGDPKIIPAWFMCEKTIYDNLE